MSSARASRCQISELTYWRARAKHYLLKGQTLNKYLFRSCCIYRCMYRSRGILYLTLPLRKRIISSGYKAKHRFSVCKFPFAGSCASHDVDVTQNRILMDTCRLYVAPFGCCFLVNIDVGYREIRTWSPFLFCTIKPNAYDVSDFPRIHALPCSHIQNFSQKL